jgi:16S rRNA processing protein RimM
VPSPARRKPELDPSETILVARVGAAHGLAGEVRVKPLTADPMAIVGYRELTTAQGAHLLVEKARPAAGSSPDMLVVRFAGIDRREAAEALNGLDLYIGRAALPAPDADEYYHADLIGLAAVTAEGEALGTITGVENYGAGDLLAIAPRRGDPFLLPFTRAYVPEVDLAGRRVVVAPPPGLIEEPAEEGR